MVRQTEQQSAYRKEDEARVGSPRWIWSHNIKGTCGDARWRPVTGVTSPSGMFLEPLTSFLTRPLLLKWSIDMWQSCEPVLSSTPIVILPVSGQNVKVWAPPGETELSPYLRSLVLTAVPLLTLFSNSAAFPVINEWWILLFLKWKIIPHTFLYPLLIIFFYSTWLGLIDIFYLHGIHFLLTLWKMRKVTSTKELGHKDQLRESDRLCCCII